MISKILISLPPPPLPQALVQKVLLVVAVFSHHEPLSASVKAEKVLG